MLRGDGRGAKAAGRKPRGRRPEAKGRRPEAEGRRPEAEGRRPEAEDLRSEAFGRPWESLENFWPMNFLENDFGGFLRATILHILKRT